jgi:GT2 family glycosyltransferase
VANYFGARAKRSFLLRRFRYDLDDVDFSGPAVVEDPMSGCSAFRRKLFPDLPLSREFGIFWSDAELSRRIWNSGHIAMVFPDVRFVHDHDDTPRAIRTEATLALVTDYIVGCTIYFRKYVGRGAAVRAKTYFAVGALAALILKHLPLAIIGREPWGMWRARVGVIRDILRSHNPLLLAARSRANREGAAQELSIL